MNTKTLIIIVLLFCALAICACEQSEQAPVWGKGDLPADFEKTFGPGNGPRLDFIQNRIINGHTKIIRELSMRILLLEGVDPNSFAPPVPVSPDDARAPQKEE